MSQAFTPSSRANPCPVCGRTRDGDCRSLSDGRVLCHTHREHFKPGDRPPSGPGFRFAKASDEAQGFGIWIPADQWEERPGSVPRAAGHRFSAIAVSGSPQSASPPQAVLANKLTRPAARNTFRFRTWDGAEVQAAKHRVDHGDGTPKQVRWQPSLSNAGLTQADLAPCWWHEAIAHHQQHGGPVLVVKGELKALWLRQLGLQAISLNGWDSKVAEGLLPLGADAVLVPDCDLADLNGWYAQATAACPQARHLLVSGASWANPPAKEGVGIDDWLQQCAGSITADAVLQAITSNPWQPQGVDGEQGAARARRIRSKAELQQFLRDTYRLEFNELTRVCEINSNPLEDHHLADSFLAQQHGIEVSKQMAADSFEFVAKSNPYNPVRRYLLGLRERSSDLRLIPMEELAAAFAIEPHDQISQHLLASHLAGAAMRGLTPGHKHDQILILRGEQGTFKSSAIEALAGPWYDSATRVEELESKDFLARINGAWLFEIDECEHTLLKRTASEFKGFISRRNDRYAEKYEKNAKTHWRRSALFGTTNQAEFLNDSTGNRRAWVIDTGDRELSPQWISANRDSIWATVLTWIDWGLTSHTGRNFELAAAAAERAQEANLSDPWEGPLAQVLETIPANSCVGIAQDDLIERALGISTRDCSRDVQMRVARVVTGSGFRTHGGTVAWQSKKRRYGGGRPRAGYAPVGLSEAAGSRVPTVPSDSAKNKGVGTEVGTGQTPWQNRDLATPFQPVPTFSLKKDRDKEEGEQDARNDVTLLPPEVGTGWNTPEIHSAARDLAVPTGSEQQGGRNGTAHPQVGTPAPSPDDRLSAPVSHGQLPVDPSHPGGSGPIGQSPADRLTGSVDRLTPQQSADPFDGLIPSPESPTDPPPPGALLLCDNGWGSFAKPAHFLAVDSAGRWQLRWHPSGVTDSRRPDQCRIAVPRHSDQGEVAA